VNDSVDLTRTEISAAAERALVAAGYRRVSDQQLGENAQDGRAYEDVYGLVYIYVFDTVDNLMNGWHQAQGQLVSLMTKFVSAQEAKAWDGYLVLLTPERHSPPQYADIQALRRDTHRVRKLVATGSRLRALSDVTGVLQPLLPLELPDAAVVPESPFDLLPAVLQEHDVDPQLTRALIDRFEQQGALMRTLAEWEAPS
jgi:hypothetical protein